MAKLTAKQIRFVEEYLIDLNGTQAAIRAGYSPKAARQQAARLLTNAAIEDLISEKKNERSERTKIDADYVLKRLFELESFDLSGMFDDDGRMLPPELWPEGAGRVIGGVTTTKTILPGGRGDEDGEIETKSIRTESRARLLKLMGEHVDVKAYDKTVKVEVPKVVKRYLGKAASS